MSLSGYYYLLRQRIPFYIFLLYVLNRGKKRRRVFEYLNNGVFALIAGIVVFLLYGMYSKIKFIEWVNLRWSYYGALEWCFLNIALYFYFRVKKVDSLYGLNFMAQATNAGGWIYELPYFIFASEGRLFASNYIFFINLQIVSILLLAWALKDRKFKFNKIIKYSLSIYVLYSILTMFNHDLFIRLDYIQRLPTILMMFTLATGVEEGPQSR